MLEMLFPKWPEDIFSEISQAGDQILTSRGVVKKMGYNHIGQSELQLILSSLQNFYALHKVIHIICN